MAIRRRTMLGTAGAALLPTALAAQPNQQVRGELSVVWNAWPDPHVTPVLERFRSLHPNVVVRDERLPFAELVRTLEIRLQARGPTPDIYLCDGPLTASYAVRRHLAELDDVIGDLSRYTRAARDQGTFRGKLYSQPLLSSSQLLYVNRKRFADAGIAPPEPDTAKRWTWEQVLEAARKMTDRSANSWGLVVEQSDRPYQILPLAQSMGAQAIGPDGMTATGFVDSAPFAQGIGWYGALYHRHQVAPPDIFDGNLAQEVFGTGRAAMFLGGPWNMEIFRGRPVEWTPAPHPYFAAGTPVTPTGSWHIGMNPRTRNREAAEAFIRTFADPETIALQAKLRPNPPVLNAVWDMMAADLGSPGWQIVRHELQNTAVPRPATPGWREYEDILRIAIREIMGGAEPAARLGRAARDIDREMAKYRS